MMSGGSAGASPCQARAWRQASSSTHRPIGTISPVSSASGMNSPARSAPPLGVLPAHQRLDLADRRRVASVDDRLVVEPKLAALERPAQVGLQLQPLQRTRRACRRRRPRSAPCPAPWPGTWPGRRRAAASSAPVLARAAAARSRCWRRRTPRGRRAANGAAQRAAIRSATADGAASVRRGPRAGRRTRRPPSRATVSSARTQRSQPLGHRDQQPVAGLVPEAVVDDLEVVEVEEEHRDRASARRSARARACSRRSRNRARFGRLVNALRAAPSAPAPRIR